MSLIGYVSDLVRRHPAATLFTGIAVASAFATIYKIPETPHSPAVPLSEKLLDDNFPQNFYRAIGNAAGRQCNGETPLFV